MFCTWNSMSLVVAGHLPLVAFFSGTGIACNVVIITFASTEIVITLSKYVLTWIFTHECTGSWFKLKGLCIKQLHPHKVI